MCSVTFADSVCNKLGVGSGGVSKKMLKIQEKPAGTTCYQQGYQKPGNARGCARRDWLSIWCSDLHRHGLLCHMAAGGTSAPASRGKSLIFCNSPPPTQGQPGKPQRPHIGERVESNSRDSRSTWD